MSRVKVDWQAVDAVMHAYFEERYLCRETGRIRGPDPADDEPGPGPTEVVIPRRHPTIDLNWMARFADTQPELPVRLRLLEPIREPKGAAERFLAQLQQEGALVDEWSLYRDAQAAAYVARWLAAEGVDAELDPPPPTPVTHLPTRSTAEYDEALRDLVLAAAERIAGQAPPAALIALLRGEVHPALGEASREHPHFGWLAERSAAEVEALVRELFHEGWLSETRQLQRDGAGELVLAFTREGLARALRARSAELEIVLAEAAAAGTPEAFDAAVDAVSFQLCQCFLAQLAVEKIREHADLLRAWRDRVPNPLRVEVHRALRRADLR